MRKLFRVTWLPGCLLFALLGTGSASAQVMGAAPLSISAIQTIRASVNNALAPVRKDDNLVKTAISDATREAVARYGEDTASAIASTVMVTAEAAGIRLQTVGEGLGQASVALAPVTCKGYGGHPALDCRVAATAIAQTMANEGRMDEVIAYQRIVIALEYPKLARIAGAGGTPVGAINPSGGGSLPGSSFVGGAGAGGGCLTPSCTHL